AGGVGGVCVPHVANVPEVAAWQAVIFSLTVLATGFMSIRHPSKRRIFLVLAMAEAVVLQKAASPLWGYVIQTVLFTLFAHVLFFGRIALQETPSLLWVVVSSVWILLVPWFIAGPVALVATGIILPRAMDAWRRAQEEVSGPDTTPRLDALT
ncbi:MAG: hypothetical protein ACHQC8_06440, partial [Solirubrobacterales bacterium]